MAHKHHQKNRRLSDQDYRNLVLASIIVVEIGMIFLIRIWPERSYEKPVLNYDIPNQEIAVLDDIEITHQESSPPPPPKPQIPVPVPNDKIINQDIDFTVDMDLPNLPALDPGFGSGLSGDSDRIISNPQVPPSIVRIVEATAPKGVPSDYKGRLEMIVNFLVNKEGEVEEASIMEIRLYNRDGSYEELEYVQHGLMDAVVKAALQWKFRPARQNGEPVKAFTKQRFNY